MLNLSFRGAGALFLIEHDRYIPAAAMALYILSELPAKYGTACHRRLCRICNLFQPVCRPFRPIGHERAGRRAWAKIEQL